MPTSVRKHCAGASKSVKGHVRAVESLSAARALDPRSGDTHVAPTARYALSNAWEHRNRAPAKTPSRARAYS